MNILLKVQFHFVFIKYLPFSESFAPLLLLSVFVHTPLSLLGLMSESMYTMFLQKNTNADFPFDK
jgi:hypothetical protein